ncbi:MAG: tetratricopeptide repeat protein, partial [Thermodesulfobacteriota bacterium]
MTTEQKVTRKLRGILSADVKGYSLLMTNDEASTIKTLKEYRIIMSAIIKHHSGRVVDAPGDNLLAEFPSAVDAVQCSVEIQNALKVRNADLPDDKRLEFRIGVNIGDVVQDGDSLYGEGVNIAARIEGLADPGGVCISRGTYDHIRNKLDFGYEYLGDHSVKNIKHPVRVYKILMESEDAGKLIGEKPKSQATKWIFSTIVVAAIAFALIGYQLFQKITAPEFKPASIEKMAYTLPVEPSIAVLPFENMSGDSEQEYFSDGITEQIITSLSNVPYLFVIARNSTFTYKNKPVKVQQVAEELGVQYVLEGSIQRSGDRIRVTAQLIDAVTGYHLWAENFDRKMADIFQLQDEITMKIIAKLQVELSTTELGRVSAVKTEDLRAYEKYLKGYRHIYNRSIGDTLKARKLAEEAIELDPEYGAAYQLMALTYLDEIYLHRVKSRGEFLEKAEKLIQKSIKLSGEDYKTHRTLSSLYFLKKQSDKAIIEAQKAIELNPNSADSYYIYGMVLGLIGNYDQAISNLKKAIRLNPVTPINYLNQLAFAHFYKNQYEKAIPLWELTLKRNPDYYYAHMGLTAAYQLNGEKDKTRKAAAELIRVKPSFAVSVIEKRVLQKNKESKKLFLGALRKAGVPEYPPGKEIEKPSIAVLPFNNMSDDPQQEYFSDGITEDIITDLSKISNLIV